MDGMTIRMAVRTCNSSRADLLDSQILGVLQGVDVIPTPLTKDGRSLFLAKNAIESLEKVKGLEGKIVSGMISVPKAIYLREMFQDGRGIYERPFVSLPDWEMVNGQGVIIEEVDHYLAANLTKAGWREIGLRTPSGWVLDGVGLYMAQLDEFRRLNNEFAEGRWKKFLGQGDAYSENDNAMINYAPCDGFGLPQMLKLGDCCPAVAKLQMKLKKRYELEDYTPSGVFGAETVVLVAQYLKEQGVMMEGDPAEMAFIPLHGIDDI